MDQYYITISNRYGDTNQMFASSLELNPAKKWGIALTECLVPSNVEQIAKSSLLATVTSNNNNNNASITKVYATKGSVNEDNLDDLVKHLNRNYFAPLEFFMAKIAQSSGAMKLQITPINESKAPLDVTFHGKTALMLGFLPDTKQNMTNSSSFNADPFIGGYNLLMYCSQIEETVVGNSLVPIVRIIPLNKSSTFTNRVFKNLHYVPLKRFNLEKLQLSVRTILGDLVSLNYFNFTFHIKNL